MSGKQITGLGRLYTPESDMSQSKAATGTQKPAVLCTDGRLTFSKLASQLELWKPQPMVTFVIGGEDVKQTFIVHKALATSSSPFFKAAFEGQFIEGETQTIRLEDIDSRIFGILVHWIYTHRVIHVADDQDLVLACGGPLLIYAKIWTLAGRFLMPTLQNHLMMKLSTCLHFENNKARRKEFVSYASRTDAEVPLKLLAVQAVAFFVDIKEVGDYVADLPGDFVAEVMVALRKEVGRVRSELVNRLSFRASGDYYVKEP